MKNFKYYLDKIGEVGFVETVTKSMAAVNGLPGVKPQETVVFESGEIGMALFLHQDWTEVLLLSEGRLTPGVRVARTGEELSLEMGEELLGSVIDPLGKPLVAAGKRKPLGQRLKIINPGAPGIEMRVSVRRPLETGVSIVDALVPLGKGQRELVIGDRKTGKTTFLLQTALRQAKEGTICLYASIGRRQAEVKEIEDFFSKQGVMEKIILIAASANAPASLVYLAPYTACAMAEYFRDQGIDSLVILDDLTAHARFYREICLLAQRFPGRDSYPVDIFFTHAGLLEKGGNFKTPKGEAAITILPVAQTAGGDLSGYIQTNLMSMTDGHIYFDASLFAEGRRPAINPFLSVTRVGRQAQPPLRRELSRELLAFLTNYERLQSFAHFGAELTEEVKAILVKGEKMTSFFGQSQTASLPINIVVFILGMIWKGFEGDLAKLMEKYATNRLFRKKVDKIAEGSQTLREMLGKIKNDY